MNEELKSKLRGHGYDLDRLAVLSFGKDDFLVGAVMENVLVGGPVTVLYPKRLLPLRAIDRATGALSVEYRILPWDYADSTLQVIAPQGFWLKHQSEKMQDELGKGLLGFLESQIEERAIEAGVLLPKKGIAAQLR